MEIEFTGVPLMVLPHCEVFRAILEHSCMLRSFMEPRQKCLSGLIEDLCKTKHRPLMLFIANIVLSVHRNHTLFPQFISRHVYICDVINRRELLMKIPVEFQLK